MRIASRAFFLQDLVAKFVGLLPPVIAFNLAKYDALKKAFYLTSLEGVQGDYLEFGVYTGSSLSAAINYTKKSFLPRDRPMRYFGFDSFQGFGNLLEEEKNHPFFKDTNFTTSEEMVRKRVSRKVSDKSRVQLIPGFYEQTLKREAAFRFWHFKGRSHLD